MLQFAVGDVHSLLTLFHSSQIFYSSLIYHVYALNNRKKKEEKLAGGCAYEYYPRANAGLLSYIIIHSTYRSKGISSELIAHVQNKLNDVSKRIYGYKRGCVGIFAETNRKGCVCALIVF